MHFFLLCITLIASNMLFIWPFQLILLLLKYSRFLQSPNLSIHGKCTVRTTKFFLKEVTSYRKRYVPISRFGWISIRSDRFRSDFCSFGSIFIRFALFLFIRTDFRCSDRFDKKSSIEVEGRGKNWDWRRRCSEQINNTMKR